MDIICIFTAFITSDFWWLSFLDVETSWGTSWIHSCKDAARSLPLFQSLGCAGDLCVLASFFRQGLSLWSGRWRMVYPRVEWGLHGLAFCEGRMGWKRGNFLPWNPYISLKEDWLAFLDHVSTLRSLVGNGIVYARVSTPTATLP